MPRAMTPGVMSDSVLLSNHADSRSKASSEPTSHATLNSNKKALNRAAVGNGNGDDGSVGSRGGREGGIGGGNGNADLKLGKGNNEVGLAEGVLDMSVLAPALPKIKQGFYPLK